MSEVGYNNLALQTYMQSPLFTAQDAAILFALRTRTLRGIKDDFRNMYADNKCPLDCGDIDSLKNMLTCTSLQSNLESQFSTRNQVRYEHVFSNDIIKQKEATELFKNLLTLREKLLNSLPVSDTGHVH